MNGRVWGTVSEETLAQHQPSEQHGEHAEEPEQLDDMGALLAPHFKTERFPWKQVLGFVGSLVLTLVALDLVVDHMLPTQVLIMVILALAVVQAAWQLGFFMHLRESHGPAWHIGMIALGGSIGVLLIIFSIWIMTFKYGVS